MPPAGIAVLNHSTQKLKIVLWDGTVEDLSFDTNQLTGFSQFFLVLGILKVLGSVTIAASDGNNTRFVTIGSQPLTEDNRDALLSVMESLVNDADLQTTRIVPPGHSPHGVGAASQFVEHCKPIQR